MTDPFVAAGIDLPAAIRAIAERHEVSLTDDAVAAIAHHARRVRIESERLHLTSIHDPREFLDRHVEESIVGAAQLDPALEGVMVDLGSGNGYPAMPIAAARPGLRLVMAEAAAKKAAFLGDLIEESHLNAAVLNAQVQRPEDLAEVGPVHVVTTRAMGNWERLVPRLHPALAPGAELLIWAGASMEQVSTQKRWKRFDLNGKTALPGRDRAWIWHFCFLSG